MRTEGGRAKRPPTSHLHYFLRDVANGEAVEADPVGEDAGEDPSVQLESDLAHDTFKGCSLGI